MAQNQPIEIPAQTREAMINPSTWRDEDSSVELVWSTGARRRAYDWSMDQVYDEELVIDDSAVDMTRFEAGTVQVLDGHRAWGGTDAILGIATRGWLEQSKGCAQIKLRTSTPELASKAADVKTGLIRAVSFGYSVQRYEITRAQDRTDGGTVPLYRATRWTPQEISFVAVPADPHAGTRSQHPSHPCEFIRADAQPSKELRMTQTVANPSVAATEGAASVVAAAAVQTTDVQRAADQATLSADISKLCVRHGMPELAERLIREQASIEKANAAVLEERAVRDANLGGRPSAPNVQTVRDETQTQLRGIEEALNHRLDARVKLTDNGRQFRSLSLLELGREHLQSRGVQTRGLDKMRLATEILQYRSPGMHSTSDFGALLGSVANKRLRDAYDENPGTYSQWARRAPNAPDFKNIQVVALSGAPDLLRTNEHGEFTYGTLRDGAETYAVVTYGRIVSLTRQMLVNDDLRAFDRLLSLYGFAARRLENRTVYSQLTANANLSDGVALFAAAGGARKQGNVQTGAPSALSVASLNAGRKAMRLMKGMNDEELNIVPAHLIVPAELETTGGQLTSANYVPATQQAINEFRAGGRTAVNLIVEPLLDGNSPTAWYMASSSSQIDTVEYCYLDGADGPVIESEPGFEVDGISWKCRLDFGAKALDYRGLHRSAGA